jgi:hypothetical protein
MLTIAFEAGQEAALDALLHGIHSKWASLEFAVQLYKGAKDVFVLAGFEEVASLLEDSNISMAAAMSNRRAPRLKCAPMSGALQPQMCNHITSIVRSTPVSPAQSTLLARCGAS